MSCCCGGICIACAPPKERPHFAQLSGVEYDATLTGIMVPVADKLRGLFTCFGQRPYQVRLVHTEWSGNKRGSGVEQVVRVVYIEPTPLVKGIGGMTLTVQSVGLDEVGSATVEEISGTYHEEFLRGLGPLGEPIPPNQNFFWEILFPRDGVPPLLRRFAIRGSPEWQPDKFQWKVNLIKSSEDRERNGDPSP